MVETLDETTTVLMSVKKWEWDKNIITCIQEELLVHGWLKE